jgi:anti-sigma regulatory factor (Ser/Thr protein kinase)
MRRAGLRPISRMSANWTWSASARERRLQQPDLLAVDGHEDRLAGGDPGADEGQRTGHELRVTGVQERIVPELPRGAPGCRGDAQIRAAATACRVARTTQACAGTAPSAGATRRAVVVFARHPPGHTRFQVRPLARRAAWHASKGGACVSLSDGQPSQVNELAVRLLADADQVPVARRAVAEFCERSGMPAPLIDDIKLVVTEACTNVVLHAYPPDAPGERTFELSARFEPGALVVSVSDQGRGIGAPSANRGLGLGLRLALQLAGGVHTRDGNGGLGTRLTMRFELPE